MVFHKHSHLPSSRNMRDRDVRRVLWITLVLNVLVAMLKLVFGFFAGAVSMLADGFHSLLDGSSNVVGLVGLKIAGKAPDADHPYGHRKAEALAAVGISLFLFITCYEILTEVWERLRGDHDVRPTAVTFAIMGFTLLVNVFITQYERREGKRLKSMILIADAKHTMSDVFTSIAVIVSLSAAVLDFPLLDLIVAVGIAGFIAYSGYTIIHEAFTVLSDSQAVDPVEVAEIAGGVAGILDAHHIRSRGLPDDVHLDFHIHVSPEMTVQAAHDLAHEAAERIKARIPGVTDVVVHVEPEGEHPAGEVAPGR
jgi:cation diffusion facilitator family transporter